MYRVKNPYSYDIYRIRYGEWDTFILQCQK